MTWTKEQRREYMRVYMRKWNAEHREQVRENDRRSRERNAEGRAERRAKPERRVEARERSKAYRERLGFDGRRDQMLKQRYGFGLDEYNRLVDLQEGRCPICNIWLGQTRTHVDHDHRTGEVRAVLCGCCNQAIGMLHESPAAAERLAAYLRRHGRE